MTKASVSVTACTHIRPLTPQMASMTKESTVKMIPRRSTARSREAFHLPTAWNTELYILNRLMPMMHQLQHRMKVAATWMVSAWGVKMPAMTSGISCTMMRNRMEKIHRILKERLHTW